MSSKMMLISNFYKLRTVSCLILIFFMLVFGCAGMPIAEQNESFKRAQAAYIQAQNNPDVITKAPVALYEAGQALQKAEKAENPADMDHLSYVAERKSQIAVMIAEQKKAEAEQEELLRQKDRILIKARERELETAKKDAEQKAMEAEQARKEAEARALQLERARGESQARLMEIERTKREVEAKALEAERARRQAEIRSLELEQARKEAEARALQLEQAEAEKQARLSEIEQIKKEAEAKALEVERARKDAEAKEREAIKARQEAEKALEQTKELERELADLKAKRTERGIVLTLGDILFETGKAALMPGAMTNIDKIVNFLKKNPNRIVVVEGHTDSRGSDYYNLGLSQGRAEAVRNLMVSEGIGADRITAKGYGEKVPVANNATAAGRQQNRRVEVVILNEGMAE